GPVDAQPAAYRGQPGPQRGVAPPPAERAIGPQERVLGQLLRGHLFPGGKERDPPHRRVVTAHEHLESPSITAGRAGGQGGVSRRAHTRPPALSEHDLPHQREFLTTSTAAATQNAWLRQSSSTPRSPPSGPAAGMHPARSVNRRPAASARP